MRRYWPSRPVRPWRCGWGNASRVRRLPSSAAGRGPARRLAVRLTLRPAVHVAVARAIARMAGVKGRAKPGFVRGRRQSVPDTPPAPLQGGFAPSPAALHVASWRPARGVGTGRGGLCRPRCPRGRRWLGAAHLPLAPSGAGAPSSHVGGRSSVAEALYRCCEQ